MLYSKHEYFHVYRPFLEVFQRQVDLIHTSLFRQMPLIFERKSISEASKLSS
jgi:hypothetical protein